MFVGPRWSAAAQRQNAGAAHGQSPLAVDEVGQREDGAGVGNDETAAAAGEGEAGGRRGARSGVGKDARGAAGVAQDDGAAAEGAEDGIADGPVADDEGTIEGVDAAESQGPAADLGQRGAGAAEAAGVGRVGVVAADAKRDGRAAVLVRLKLPAPASPPTMRLVTPPMFNGPLPVVTKVLFCRASVLAICRVPPAKTVLPE